ncbi:MAG: Mannose-6-phosphate isomerase [uncultured Phycisphaerae bacterium]|uniref:Mannose-6-phosphate isomerase n=1 Tax=uncultured Phycisphaerae bacterium TaxID=904963 RepID=A0A6J4QCW7_9BACT|nr:MAG: Mannose-6-phosphate isomerase [uncultured Phycisphaerae bacterium]
MDLYPLKFKPRLVEKIWGGQKLQTVLGKPLPPGKPIGESWELYDFPPGVVEKSGGWVSAEVANGPLAGRSLHALLAEFGADVHGDVPLLPVAGSAVGQFPILIKFLDAREDLSVQVHPTEAYARSHPGAYLKTEAWYVVQSDAGSRILKGLKPGVGREPFERAIKDGSVEALITAIPVRDGQCHFLPSGTVHALGAGALVAEVQTPSDTTYRVFDFDRVEPATGKPRQLHVAEALDCIDFGGAAAPEQPRSHVAGMFTTVSRLVTCPYFKLEKVRFTEGVEEPVPYDEPVVWMMLQGEAEVRTKGGGATRFARGDTLLLPAAMREPVIKTLSDCAWLEVTFPTEVELH